MTYVGVEQISGTSGGRMSNMTPDFKVEVVAATCAEQANYSDGKATLGIVSLDDIANNF